MATTVIHGHAASLTWSGDGATEDMADTKCTNWTLDMSVQIIDVTSLDDTNSGWRERVTGRKNYTVTVDSLEVTAGDTSGGPEIGTIAELALIDGTNTITLGNSMCTNIAKTNDAEDVVRTTFTFVCAGNPA